MSIQAPASARPAVAYRRCHRREGGLLPLVRLRAPVLCVGHQLHRSPGDRHPQADAAAAVRLERARLRRHRVFVPARVRDRVSVRRPHDGSARHAAGFRDRDRRVERCRDGACVGHVLRRRRCRDARDVRADIQRIGRRLHGRALRARVSAKRATSPARSRRSPNGFPRKERAFATGIFNAGTNIGALLTPLIVPDHHDCRTGWEWAFIATGALGFLWLVAVVDVVSLARGTSAGQPGRARVHPQRSA